MRTALVAATAGALVLLGGLAGYLGASGHGSSGLLPRVSSATTTEALGALDMGVPYGATPREVLRLVGAPTKKGSGCWLYSGKAKVHGPDVDRYIDAMKFCFADGPTGAEAVTRIFSHSPAHTIVMKDPATGRTIRRRFPASWGGIVTLMRPPDWYLQQNS